MKSTQGKPTCAGAHREIPDLVALLQICIAQFRQPQDLHYSGIWVFTLVKLVVVFEVDIGGRRRPEVSHHPCQRLGTVDRMRILTRTTIQHTYYIYCQRL